MSAPCVTLAEYPSSYTSSNDPYSGYVYVWYNFTNIVTDQYRFPVLLTAGKYSCVTYRVPLKQVCDPAISYYNPSQVSSWVMCVTTGSQAWLKVMHEGEHACAACFHRGRHFFEQWHRHNQRSW
jgi:hypothetical protein